MPANPVKDLKDALDLGLGIVTRIWDYRAKNWVTSVFAADIDGDGEVEVIACSRDGRVHLLSKYGDLRWERIIGAKAWVGTGVASDLLSDEAFAASRIFVGTRDGMVFVLNKDGQTITRDGRELPYDKEGKALNPKQEQEACWYNTGGYVIRQITVDLKQRSEIIIGSEDRCIYRLDFATGKEIWKYQTNGWVRAVCLCDINNDGQDEILAGSVDRHLYLFDAQGNLLEKYYIGHSIYSLIATDLDQDGQIEILAATDGKELVALNYLVNPQHPTACLQEKWRQPFGHRMLSLCATDLDGDGYLEIIAGSEDKHLYILDSQGNTIWRHNHKYRVFSICPFDIDNDGLPELLVGSGHGRVRAMRIRLNRGVDKKIRSCYRRVLKADPASMADLTPDERSLLEEIMNMNVRKPVTFMQAQEQMQAKAYDQALLTLIKLEKQKVEQLWHHDIKSIRTVCLRRIIGETTLEIIVGTSTGDIYAFNNRGRRKWLASLNDNIVDIQTGFIDRHRQEEIVICSSDHHVYIVSGPEKQKQRNIYIDDSWMSSICVTAPNWHSPVEIIIGSEDRKLYIYGSDLKTPLETIATAEGVRIVRTYIPSEGQTPEIVTASMGNSIYAYTRYGKCLWSHQTRDQIKAIAIKDIDGDGKVEILVGSEDCNIHALDSTGELLWRYYLPHSVRAIDIKDDDNKIFVGCADAHLYVFNKDGNLQWTYQAQDRIHTVRVEDIDDDGQVEIVISSEDQIEVLRIVDLLQVKKMLELCWTALCQQRSAERVIAELLKNPEADPFLQAFALNKMAEQNHSTPKDFDILEKLAKEGKLEVRKTLTRAAMILYPVNPQQARPLLHQLWTDNDHDVRTAFVEHIQTLINYDWAFGFYYLERAASHHDRYIRRLAIRAMHQLIAVSGERQLDTYREIFRLLLNAAQDQESEWIRQEAARTLAYLLNQDHGKLIIYVHLFIVKEIHLSIWLHIARVVTNPIVKGYLNAVIKILFHLTEENALEILQQITNALEAAEAFIYGKDSRLIYIELTRLFAIETPAGIANYQCVLSANLFDANNKFARIILEIFNKLSIISRPIKMYLWRGGAQDRLASLLEAIEAIDQMRDYVEMQYSLSLLGEPITKLPDHQIFVLLLRKWRKLLQSQVNELRGKAELQAELQTKEARNEELVGLWLAVKNIGRGPAIAVKISLLHNEDKHFDIVGSNAFETEVIHPQEEVTAEFILKPHCTRLPLNFDMIYDDADNTMQLQRFEDCLLLQDTYQEFRYIPNPYSTGTPTQDSKMFYGREKDMNFLKDNLTRDVKSVIILYGQRRSGKTTVLLQLLNTPILGGHIPVLIDLQRLSYLIAIDTLLHRIAYYIAQAMRKKNIILSTPHELDNFKKDPIHTFDLFLDQVEEHLTGRKLILLIDEFEILEDQVTKGKLQPEIFDYLRDIVQHRKNINFLFSGTHKITEHTRWYRSIFFNIAIHHQLSRLSPQGAEALIQRPVEGYLEYEPFTVKKIRQLTADQPYLIHLMCRAIVDYCNERGKTFVTLNDANVVLQNVMQTGGFHFEWLWDQITPEDRVTLAAIAEGGKEEGRLLSLSQIEAIYRFNRIPYKREYVLESLKTLMEADIIDGIQSDTRKTRLDSRQFKIPVGLSRIWLLKEHPLELVRREMMD